MTAPAKIGRYEIVRRLGKSVADVYLAIDSQEGRRVALKLIPATGDAVSRMVRWKRSGAGRRSNRSCTRRIRG